MRLSCTRIEWSESSTAPEQIDENLDIQNTLCVQYLGEVGLNAIMKCYLCVY